MIRRTLGDVRSEISRVSGLSGMSLTDARFVARVNGAIEELMNIGDWPGVVDRWRITATGGIVVLPAHLDRLMQVCVDGAPKQMRSPWYEFMQYGPGEQKRGSAWVDVVLDRDEVCTRVVLPVGNWKLGVASSDTGDVGNVNLQGSGPSGLEVVEDVALGATSANEFSVLNVVIKPVTKGHVTLTASQGSETITLSVYGPNETTPSYRSYFVPALDGDVAAGAKRILLARARRRFVPVQKDTDVVLISNVAALKSMIQAIEKRDSGNVENMPLYKAFKTLAIEALMDEARSYRGVSKSPVIDFQRGVSLGGDMATVR